MILKRENSINLLLDNNKLFLDEELIRSYGWSCCYNHYGLTLNDRYGCKFSYISIERGYIYLNTHSNMLLIISYDIQKDCYHRRINHE